MQNKSVVARCEGWRSDCKDIDSKTERVWGKGTILYPGYGGSYMNLYMCSN